MFPRFNQEHSESKVKSIMYQSLRNISSSVKSLSGVWNVGMMAAASWEVCEEGDESSPLIYKIISVCRQIFIHVQRGTKSVANHML